MKGRKKQRLKIMYIFDLLRPVNHEGRTREQEKKKKGRKKEKNRKNRHVHHNTR